MEDAFQLFKVGLHGGPAQLADLDRLGLGSGLVSFFDDLRSSYVNVKSRLTFEYRKG